MGMVIFTERALIGDIFHIFSHALMKSTLFLAAGAIIWKTGLRNINELHGIGKKMPLTMGAFTLAALAMIGIPPLNGFLSKLNLGLGALEAGAPVLLFVLLVSSLLNGLYYLPIIIAAFFEGGHPADARHGVKPQRMSEATWWMLIPLGLLALSCLFFGLMPGNIFFELSRQAAAFLYALGGTVK
jgi:multicomponent Na+:H+ antiporter subunit D